MSNYLKETKHPVSGKWEMAEWLDDEFGSHKYGVRFPSNADIVYNAEQYKLETRETELEPPESTHVGPKSGHTTHFSGKKDEYKSGATRDNRTGKGRFDLISPIMLRRLAGVYERGAKNHGDNNWMKGIPFSRLMDSALRHLNQYHEGKKDEDHLAQAIWNITAMIHFDEINPQLNDLTDGKEV